MVPVRKIVLFKYLYQLNRAIPHGKDDSAPSQPFKHSEDHLQSLQSNSQHTQAQTQIQTRTAHTKTQMENLKVVALR